LGYLNAACAPGRLGSGVRRAISSPCDPDKGINLSPHTITSVALRAEIEILTDWESSGRTGLLLPVPRPRTHRAHHHQCPQQHHESQRQQTSATGSPPEHRARPPPTSRAKERPSQSAIHAWMVPRAPEHCKNLLLVHQFPSPGDYLRRQVTVILSHLRSHCSTSTRLFPEMVLTGG